LMFTMGNSMSDWGELNTIQRAAVRTLNVQLGQRRDNDNLDWSS
jgi:hypothetical protein